MEMKMNPNHGRVIQQLGWIRDKLVEIEQKLDHIIYRVAEEDPRSLKYRGWLDGINGSDWSNDDREETHDENQTD